MSLSKSGPLKVFFFLFIALVSCRGDEGPDGSVETKVVDDFMKAFTSKDLDAASEFLLENSMTYGPAVTDSASVDEWLATWQENFKNNITSITYTRSAQKFVQVTIQENPAIAGNWVLEWGMMNATYTDDSEAGIWWHAAFRVESGKITLSRAFFDRADLLTQRGYEIVPPQMEMPQDSTMN